MRRPAPLTVVTIALIVLYLAAGVALGTTPEAKDSGATVVAWFGDHGGNVRVWAWLFTVSAMVFAVYAALVRERLPAPHRDVFFFGAIALAAESAVYVWFWAGLAWRGSQLGPVTARSLIDISDYWGPVLTSTTVAMLAPIAVARLQRRIELPTLVLVVVGAAVVEQIVETITILSRSGFTAPGGPMNLMLGAGLTGLAFLAVGLALARRPPLRDV